MANVVCDLAAALDRSQNADSHYETRSVLQHACYVAMQLVDQLRADIDEDPQALASTKSRRLAASVVSDLLEVHRLQPSVESFRLYNLVGMAVYSLLVPSE